MRMRMWKWRVGVGRRMMVKRNESQTTGEEYGLGRE